MPLQLSGTSGVSDNSGAFIAGTAVASTSGTSIDFTSIPSWVKRITVMLSDVSTNAGDSYLIQIGSGSISNTGYTSLLTYTGVGTARVTATTGYLFVTSTPSQNWSGQLVISLLSGNTYIESGCFTDGVNYAVISAGTKTLSGVLDRIRFTTVAGTGVFDAGTVNITYE